MKKVRRKLFIILNIHCLKIKSIDIGKVGSASILYIVIRIKNEERVLEEGLKGYAEYKKKVKCRIIPFIW